MIPTDKTLSALAALCVVIVLVLEADEIRYAVARRWHRRSRWRGWRSWE